MTATPTPSPTPTPTPAGIYGWATPTPYPTANATAVLDFGDTEGVFVTVAEQGVQTWQMGNQDGVLDNMMTILIVILILAGFRKIIRMIRGGD